VEGYRLPRWHVVEGRAKRVLQPNLKIVAIAKIRVGDRFVGIPKSGDDKPRIPKWNIAVMPKTGAL
jgi:hypothetical protein